MKDNFSEQSANYAKYRPVYPPEFFDYLKTIITNNSKAWDCGTGNGQVAIELASIFKEVYATDISQSQIDNAHLAENIFYSVQPAEKTGFRKERFDLIVVAQAIHWFDFDAFYHEVRRTAKKQAKICVLGYGMIEIDAAIDSLITDFYTNVIGSYWDPERKYIDDNYRSIPFPFSEIETPRFVNSQRWTFEHLIGYLSTWSAVKHFIKTEGYNPVEQLAEQLKPVWGQNDEKTVNFPILLRVGSVFTG